MSESQKTEDPAYKILRIEFLGAVEQQSVVEMAALVIVSALVPDSSQIRPQSRFFKIPAGSNIDASFATDRWIAVHSPMLARTDKPRLFLDVQVPASLRAPQAVIKLRDAFNSSRIRNLSGVAMRKAAIINPANFTDDRLSMEEFKGGKLHKVDYIPCEIIPPPSVPWYTFLE